jgi:ankyrin repeat protein
MSRSTLFNIDSKGRTTLFYAAENGDMDAVKAILFKLRGTGIFPQRLALIDVEDENGNTAVDVAKKAGNEEIAGFLLGEKLRMEYFE